MVITLILSLCLSANARIKTLDDFTYIHHKYEIETEINDDGTYVETVIQDIRITKDEGRSANLQYIYFNKNSQKAELLESYTINGTKKTQVDSEFIILKDVSSDSQTIDHLMNYTVIFPEAKIGSILHLKYKRTGFKNSFGLNYARTSDVNWDYFQHYKHVVKSKNKKLFYELHNFKNDLRLIKHSDYQLEIQSIKPFTREYTDEEYIAKDSGSVLTYFVTTIKNPEDIYAHYVADYHKQSTFRSPAAIYEGSTEKADYQKIYGVVENVIKHITYVSDSRTLEKGFIPKNPEVTWSQKYGDCKDFANLTIMALKQIGFIAYPAFVLRDDEINMKNFSPIESITAANHVIVYIENYKGGHFIDPTNSEPLIDYIPTDIENRYAYILKDKPEFKMIPKSSGLGYKQTLTYSQNYDKVYGRLELDRYAAEFYARYFKLKHNDQELIDILSVISETEQLKSTFKVTTIDPINRIFEFESNSSLDFSKGKDNSSYLNIFPLNYSFFRELELKSNSRFNGYKLKFDSRAHTIYRIPASNPEIFEPENNIENEWFKINNLMSFDGKYLTYETKIESKTDFIHSDELKKFHAFLGTLKDYVKKRIVKI